jgi:intein/homing endonuclease
VTDHGTLSIVELVERVQCGECIKALSFDIDEQKLVFKLMSWASCTRKDAKLMRLKLKNGQVLKLTPDHKVYTDKGWVEAQHLTKAHRILSDRP